MSSAGEQDRAHLSPGVPEIGALDLLLSVARLGSLGRAARQLGISQPAVGSRLTNEGAVVAGWARPVSVCRRPWTWALRRPPAS